MRERERERERQRAIIINAIISNIITINNTNYCNTTINTSTIYKTINTAVDQAADVSGSPTEKQMSF